MSKRLFGDWVNTVSPDDLACALAEAGLGQDGTWRFSTALLALAESDEETARRTAATWRRERGSGSPRIAIDAPSEDALWVAECLSRAVTGKRGGVYIRQDEPTTAVGWKWPLTVGLLSDPVSRQYRDVFVERFEDHRWANSLMRLAEPGPTCDSVDLLLLPFDLADALAITLQHSPPLRADCTVVLGRGAASSARTTAYLQALRSSVRTAGVALLPRPDDLERWLVSVLEALSHNLSIDSALLYASRALEIKAPLLIASAKLVEFSQLAPHIRTMGAALESSRARAVPVEARPGSAIERRLGPGSHPLGRVGAAMREAREDEFNHETDMASLGAEGAEAAAVALAGQPAPSAEPRFIQAQVFTQALGFPPPAGEPTTAFRAGVEHRIDVRIGQSDASWLGPVAGQPFPDEELPVERDEHELRIVFVEPRLLQEPQAGIVILPKRGPSRTCRFTLKVPTGTDRVDARLIVAYGNRVLQTALLGGKVGEPITLTIEAVVRPVPAGLDDRRRFDAAVVLHQDRDGTPSLTKLASGHVAFSTAPDLQTEIHWFDRQLTEVARNRKDYAGALDTPATVDLLRSFALHGSLLYQYLVSDTLGDDALAKGERLQVVSTHPEARLPVEFVYDRKAPDAQAPLCPHAAAALARGSCDASCPRGTAERTVVCPLGFWGMSRIIERHAHDPKTSRALSAHDFAFQAEPVGARQTVSVLQGAQIAASQRVEVTVPDGIERLRSAANPVMQTPSVTVRTWDDWADKLDDVSRSLLVLLVHTETAGPGDTMSQMEIGKESWLVSARLDERYVRPSVETSPPVVLLIGCETAAPEVSFAGLASQFRRHGAAIVVSTGSKIHSDQAVPIAAGLIEQLGAIDEHAEGCFGEVMRGIRRRMLAEGHVMVLTLTAFGDADWRLTP